MLVCTQDTIQLTLCKPLSCDGALARHAGQSWALGATGRPQFSRCRHTILALCLEFAPLVAKTKLAELSNARIFHSSTCRLVSLCKYDSSKSRRASMPAAYKTSDFPSLLLVSYVSKANNSHQYSRDPCQLQQVSKELFHSLDITSPVAHYFDHGLRLAESQKRVSCQPSHTITPFREVSMKRSEKTLAQDLIQDNANSKKVVSSPLAALSSRVYFLSS